MRETMRKLWPYLRRYRQGFALGFSALILKDLLLVCQPLLIKAGVDAIAAGFSLGALWKFAGGLVFLTMLKGVFQYWMRVTLVGISRDIEYDLRNDLYAHLLQLDWSFYRQFRTGDILARATSDLNAVRMMLGPGLMYWLETLLTFLLAVAVMVSVDWRLTLIALSPAPVVSLVVAIFGRRIHHRFEGVQKRFADLSSRVQENLSGVRLIRAYVQEEAELRLFDQMNRRYVSENLQLARLSGLFSPLLQFLVGTTFLLVLWAGGYSLMAGRITLGSFVMFHTFMGMLVWPMIAFGWVVNLMERGKASFRRIDELMQRRPAICAPARPEPLPVPVRGEIVLENVSLDYDSRFVLKDITLRIAAGETVAIVGATGSGKTSLVQLIPRLVDPTGGRVLIDGVDVKQLDTETLRRQIGFVPQESFLFSASLAENIALGVPDASREAIQQAALMAGLGPDLAGFAAGLDTVVGERGITLSGGQKQRTTIARAILRRPRILILDDALSSVDAVTEERILASLRDVFRSSTTILISHRVSTVRQADRIYVLDNGRLAEQGTHAELLARGQLYAQLYQRQLIEQELEEIR